MVEPPQLKNEERVKLNHLLKRLGNVAETTTRYPKLQMHYLVEKKRSILLVSLSFQPANFLQSVVSACQKTCSKKIRKNAPVSGGNVPKTNSVKG